MPAGPGAARLLASAGLPASVGPMLMAVNLVFDERWPLPDRLAVGARAGGRYLFLVPWRKSILAGTEYWTEQQHSGAEAVASFQLEVARAFPWADLGASKVALVHRGLVPGEGGAEGLATRPRFLDHDLRDGVPGLLTVQGAKYTTARAVAERAVRLVGRKLGRSLPDLAPPLTPLPRAFPLEGRSRIRCGRWSARRWPGAWRTRSSAPGPRHRRASRRARGGGGGGDGGRARVGRGAPGPGSAALAASTRTPTMAVRPP